MRPTVHMCAWCRRKLEISPAKLPDESAVNYGICEKCLGERMAELVHQRPLRVEPRSAPGRKLGRNER